MFVRLQPFFGAPEILVEPTNRRAAVAGDEPGGVKPGKPVALALHQQQADDRLCAGDEDTVFREVVFVVERDVSESNLSVGHRPVLLGHNAVSAGLGPVL